MGSVISIILLPLDTTFLNEIVKSFVAGFGYKENKLFCEKLIIPVITPPLSTMFERLAE